MYITQSKIIHIHIYGSCPQIPYAYDLVPNFCRKKSMNISGSSFRNNSARISGGALISFPDCGVGEEESIVNMSNSEFINNYASEGGAVYIRDNGELHDTSSRFIGNSAHAGAKYKLEHTSLKQNTVILVHLF